MATQLTNKYKDSLMRAEVNFASHTFKICLMGSSFVYNPTTHDNYAAITAYELATGAGYTKGGAVLAGVAVTRDDVNNKCKVTWNNVTWTATGDIGPAVGAIIIDDSHASDIVVGFLDFGAQKTTLNGGAFTISNITVENL